MDTYIITEIRFFCTRSVPCTSTFAKVWRAGSLASNNHATNANGSNIGKTSQVSTSPPLNALVQQRREAQKDVDQLLACSTQRFAIPKGMHRGAV